MTWRSTLTWTDDSTTHRGRTWHLWKHGGSPDGRGRYDGRDYWYLHPDNGTGRADQQAVSASLGRNARVARRLAELLLTGFEFSYQLRPDGVELWRRRGGDELFPLDELLTGRHR